MAAEKIAIPVTPEAWLKNVKIIPFQVLLLYFGEKSASLVLISSNDSVERVDLMSSYTFSG